VAHRNKSTHHKARRGIALPVVLLILLALTGLALFSARYATLSEASSRNQLDAERARQAAESALRDAERDILLASDEVRAGAPCARGPRIKDRIPAFGGATGRDCPQGQCAGPGPDPSSPRPDWAGTGTNSEPWWPDSKGGRWNNDLASKPQRGSAANCTTFAGGVPLGTFTGVAPIAGVVQQPEYLIELFQRGSGDNTFYRITARGFGVSEQTQVVLQTYFQADQD
jgi:type IV pilus assembly protein PilX